MKVMSRLPKSEERLKHPQKDFFAYLGLLFLLQFIFFCQGCYLASEAHHHGRLFSQQQMLTELKDSSLKGSEQRNKIQLIESILNFCKSKGINTGWAYQTYIELERQAVSYTLSAAEPFELKAYTWSFPIVGKVPYLGFHIKKDRDREAGLLRTKGYDVATGEAAAFSSLGYFPDPLFSSFFELSPSELVHLLIHELIHRHLWIKGEVELNENLAEFGAEILTLEYLSSQPDIETRSLASYYQIGREERKVFSAWLGRFKKSLESLYTEIADHGENEKLLRKRLLMEAWTKKDWPNQLGKRWHAARFSNWNNAKILASRLYAGDDSMLARAFSCYQPTDFVVFLDDLKKKLEEFAPKEALETLCI